MTEIAEAIAGTTQDMFGDAQTEDAPEVEAPAPVAEVETETETWSLPTGDPFAADDEDDEPDFLVNSEDDEQPEEFPASEFDDEDTAKLKQQLARERKQREYAQRQYLKTARKTWEADVRAQPWGQYLPADLSGIKAESRRDFKRQARNAAKANYEVLRPHFEQLAQVKSKLKEQALAEARAEAAKAWGKPVAAGGGDVPQAASDKTEAIESARRKRSMFGITKAYIENDLI